MKTNILVLIFILAFSLSVGRSKSMLKKLLSPPPIKKVRSLPKGHTDYIALDFVGLVEQHGYSAEEHKVKTDDGYNLILHRMPNSTTSNNNRKNAVVFLQHGMIASSDTWVLMGPRKDLAYLLVDAGYDVWFGNIRGNCYGRSHVRLSTEDREFWNFSFHDMALHDIPAMIDYVLNYTGSEKLFYIGHSMGTTMSYILLSTMPEYNAKMRLVVSLAPAAYFRHEFPPGVKRILDDMPKVKKLLDSNDIYDIIPQSKFFAILGKAACSDKSAIQPICSSLLFLISGVNYAQLNKTILPYFLLYCPAGVSTKTLLHYYQCIQTGEFRAFDYGDAGNMARYKQKRPPKYDLKKITSPVAIYYGLNDALAAKEDAIELSKRLANVVNLKAISDECFNHLDFIIAIDAKILLYDQITELIKSF